MACQEYTLLKEFNVFRLSPEPISTKHSSLKKYPYLVLDFHIKEF